MYRISLPLINRTVTPETREEYLRQFRRAEVERVFLVPSTDMVLGKIYQFESLVDNLAWFEKNGIEAAIWVGTSLGHGGLLHDVGSKREDGTITPIVNLAGKAIGDTRCPLNPIFRQNMVTVFRQLATSGAKTILIDDDFRLSQRTDEFCCFCDLHLERIAEYYGRPVTREELREHITRGKPNAMRDAYLRAQGDSLRELAHRLRDAVDEVDPSVRLALCCCHCIWDSDGVDPIELTEILRGNNPALLRLHGAPYWAARSSKMMPAVLELSRMFAAFCRDTDFELINEGDAYPRPRYNTPASYVEIHDALMRADSSTHGNLKYMCDYISVPTYELGYLDYHCRNLPVHHATEQAFAGKEQQGVRIVIRPQPMGQADFDLTTPHIQSPYPMAGALLGHCGIPTTYRDKGICRAAFGETVNDIADDDLDGGLILDATAAILLTERGIDVGLDATAPLRRSLQTRKVSTMNDPYGNVRALMIDSTARLLITEPSEKACAVFHAETPEGIIPLSYCYENANGQRFLVFLFEGASLNYHSGLLRSYVMQAALTGGITFVSRRVLPVSCLGHPDLYIICAGDENSLTVGLFNCFADPIFAPLVMLDGEYRHFEGININGELKDGCELTLDDIPPYSFAVFTVKK